jgi:hypothetical protein
VPWFIYSGQGTDPEDTPGRMLADNWVAPTHPMSAVISAQISFVSCGAVALGLGLGKRHHTSQLVEPEGGGELRVFSVRLDKSAAFRDIWRRRAPPSMSNDRCRQV